MQAKVQGVTGDSHQERWDEEDFDLSDFAAPSSYGRPPFVGREALSAREVAAHVGTDTPRSLSLHAGEDAEEDWDLPELDQADKKQPNATHFSDADDDQTDTIKISALAGNTLAQLAAASAASRSSGVRSSANLVSYAGSVTHLHSVSSRSGSGGVVRMDAAGGGDWEDDLEMPDLLPSHPRPRKPSTSTASGDGDFEVRSAGETSDATSNSSSVLPRSVAGTHSSPGRFPGSTSSSAASSLLSPPRPSGQGFVESLHDTASKKQLDEKSVATPADFDDFESDFNLSPQLSRLQLSPALAKHNENSTVGKAVALWDESPLSIPLDSGAASRPSGHLPVSTSPQRSADSGERVLQQQNSMQDSDADDEGEDFLEGLEVPIGLFESRDVSRSQSKRVSAVETTTNASERLRAVLRARERGLSTSHTSSTGSPSPFSPTESERDFAAGLIISDDMDLSPGRLHAKSLSYGIKSTHRVPSGPKSVVYVPAAPRRSETDPRSASKSGHAAMRRKTGSTQSQGHVGKTQAATAAADHNLPSILSHVGHTFTSASKSSPPRASSSYSHAAGRGPSQAVLRPSNLALAPKKSAVELRAAPAFGSARPLTHGSRPPPAALNLMSKNSGEAGPRRISQISQKRSLPHMRSHSRAQVADSTSSLGLHSERAPSDNKSSLSSGSSAVVDRHAPGRASISAGADYVPPARPSTPSYFMPTKASTSRSAASTTASRTRMSALDGSHDAPNPTGTTSFRAGESSGRSSSSLMSVQQPLNSWELKPPSDDIARLTQSETRRTGKVRMLRKPARARAYTGNELDAFDDLPTNAEHENRHLSQGTRSPSILTPSRQDTQSSSVPETDITLSTGRPRRISAASNTSSGVAHKDATLRGKTTADLIAHFANQWSEKQPSMPTQRHSLSPTGGAGDNLTLGHVHERPLSTRGSRRRSKTFQSPTLIRNLAGASWSPRVIGNMRWNSLKRCWEGNENMLRDFENALSSSARPALITQMPAGNFAAASTGSFLASPTVASPTARSAQALAAASTSVPLALPSHTKAMTRDCPQIVGSMVFDAQSMKWVQADGKEESDPFADLADDSTDDLDFASEAGSADVAIRLSSISPALPRHLVEEAFGGDHHARVPGPSSSEAGAARRMRSSDLLLPLEDTMSQSGVHEAIQRARAVSASRATQRSRKETHAGIVRAIQRGDPSPPRDLQTYVHSALWRESIDAEKRHRSEVRCFYASAAAAAAPSQMPASTRASTSRSGGARSAGQGTPSGRDDLYLLQRLARQASAPSALAPHDRR